MDRQGLSPSVPTHHLHQPMPGFMPLQQGFHHPPPPLMPSPCIRVEVKLANSKSFPDCNTDLSVVTIVKKPPADNELKTVADFGRSLLTDCAPDWILKLARRHAQMRKQSQDSVFLCFGGGYDLLILLEGAAVPRDVSKVPRISVSTAISTKSEESRLGKESLPIASYSDGVWDHVSAMATAFRGPPVASEVVAVLSDNVAPYGAIEGISDRVKVVRIWTNPTSIDVAIRFDHTQNLDLSKMILSNVEQPSKTKAPTPTALVKMPAAAATQTATQTAIVKKPAAVATQTAKSSSLSLSEPVSTSTKKTPVAALTKTAATTNAATTAAVAQISPKETAASTKHNTEATAPKKRGRPKGSTNTKKTNSEGVAPALKKLKTAITPKVVAGKKTGEMNLSSEAKKHELTGDSADIAKKPKATADAVDAAKKPKATADAVDAAKKPKATDAVETTKKPKATADVADASKKPKAATESADLAKKQKVAAASPKKPKAATESADLAKKQKVAAASPKKPKAATESADAAKKQKVTADSPKKPKAAAESADAAKKQKVTADSPKKPKAKEGTSAGESPKKRGRPSKASEPSSSVAGDLPAEKKKKDSFSSKEATKTDSKEKQ